MTADIHPLRVLLRTASGWVNRQQQQVSEYLVEENLVLREHSATPCGCRPPLRLSSWRCGGRRPLRVRAERQGESPV